MFFSVENLKVLEKSKIVVVIGLAASGKTTVADYLQEHFLQEHSLYHTDDYIDYGYEQSLYKMIDDLAADPNPLKIIEGVQGYRFLRKNAELRQFQVDTVVIVETPGDKRAKRYADRGKGNLPASFDRNLQTVFTDYWKKQAEAHLIVPSPNFIRINT